MYLIYHAIIYLLISIHQLICFVVYCKLIHNISTCLEKYFLMHIFIRDQYLFMPLYFILNLHEITIPFDECNLHVNIEHYQHPRSSPVTLSSQSSPLWQPLFQFFQPHISFVRFRISHE